MELLGLVLLLELRTLTLGLELQVPGLPPRPRVANRTEKLPRVAPRARIPKLKLPGIMAL